MDLDPALEEKIRQFCSNREEYENPRFKEASVRAQFIDVLFKALGWDVYNDQGLPEQYKEVELEPSQDVSGHKRNPDYAFRVEGSPRFFVEAKKPAVRIMSHAESALQIRRYSWSAGLPLGILTDFAEIAVYDCRVPPSASDDAESQRVIYLRIEELSDSWKEFYDLFSAAAVKSGSLDRYAETAPELPARPVGTALLSDIERWRSLLAVDIFKRNAHLAASDLSYLVQATIDRIIFLRICEDKGIEPIESLRSAAEHSDVYKQLLTIFHSADQKYNSGLFHFEVEGGRAQAPDQLSLDVRIGDRILRSIIHGLYPPKSPYSFAVISLDILGQVYEQFLGREIAIVGQAVEVEEKPEIKKAGGVVYTPAWVVDFMVKSALSRLLAGATLPSVTGAGGRKATRPLRILDPACGSGSFLIEIYDYLLKWYLDKYRESPPRWSSGRNARIFPTGKADWRLTAQERKRILLQHIFGVDIDAQAVEVTKLSLLLKVVEDETKESIANQYALLYERALPDLDDNIRCGNSLVEPDIYASDGTTSVSEEEERQINAFDWSTEFGAIMGRAGFDLVIGNPPYLSYSGRQAVDLLPRVHEYFARKYTTGGWPTAQTLFMERAVRDLSSHQVSFIVPDQIGHLAGYRVARSVLGESAALVLVRYMGEDVFPGRTTPALVFLADKLSDDADTEIVDGETSSIVQLSPGDDWVPIRSSAITDKLKHQSISLGLRVADPGVHTGNCSKQLIVPAASEVAGAVPVLQGRDVFRYRAVEPEKALRLDYIAAAGEYFAIRPEGKYADAHFVIRQTAAEPIVGPRRHATYFRNTLLALYDGSGFPDTRYVVGLLNSKLLRWAYREAVRESAQRTFPQVKVTALRALPIRNVDLADSTQRAMYDQIIDSVDRMLGLCSQQEVAMSPIELRRLSSRIAATDRRIDELVYALYGLDEDEIEHVEDSYGRLAANWRLST